MELSPEDSLRLNVLLANKPLAIRIDESRMIVHGLTAQGESTVRLNPTGRQEQYVRSVRELISGHVLGSPGGYPVYLKRWTRMGQMRDESLEQLLTLGEPEAVVAAVCAPGLSDELARRAWWAMEDAGNARRMLKNPRVRAGRMGKVLANYLVDYLPFETEHEEIMETVRLVLQPGLLDETQRLDLWRKSTRKQAYLVGFIQALPDALPEPVKAREPDAVILELAAGGDLYARAMQRVYASSGQTFLKTLAAVLAKPPSQEVVIAALDGLRDYFAVVRPTGDPDLRLDDLIADVRSLFASPDAQPAAAELLARSPGLADEVAAIRFLSGVGYGLIRPLLPDPSTQGSLMRRKLAPVTDAIQARLDLLRGVAR
ncbi:sulfur reduction protein DsrS [Thiorhodococcus mannitoliphagus]|uniref:Sulfur reduction protein DsrS n=1 Tax=Thiorhodococcus mannitoliphagus TaxID=329406 RepID=A0A6P1DWR1_9GAMM|nr:sulfur reduction protein DsrS [Thiorhodococcus mannitoliphagus]NEX20562.1 sulfur reduction protein DsrS [Thiorhodococcus mannitoliphagus]